MVIQHFIVEWIGDFDWFPVQCIAPIVFWSLCNVFLLNFLWRGIACDEQCKFSCNSYACDPFIIQKELPRHAKAIVLNNTPQYNKQEARFASSL